MQSTGSAAVSAGGRAGRGPAASGPRIYYLLSYICAYIYIYIYTHNTHIIDMCMHMCVCMCIHCVCGGGAATATPHILCCLLFVIHILFKYTYYIC